MADRQAELESNKKPTNRLSDRDNSKFGYSSQSRAANSTKRIGVVAPSSLLSSLMVTPRVISVTPEKLDAHQLEALLFVPAPGAEASDPAVKIAGWPALPEDWSEAIEVVRGSQVPVGLYDLGWTPALRDADRLLKQVDFVITSSPTNFDFWRQRGVNESKIFFLPWPIDVKGYNPIQSESGKKTGLVYNLPAYGGPIPAPTRRVLAGALNSGIDTHLTKLVEQPRMYRGQGKRIAEGVIQRNHLFSTLAGIQEWNATSEFSVSDRIDLSPDGRDPGILNLLAAGSVVFSDYSKYVNGALPNVLMAETSEDFQNYLRNIPDICLTLSRIEGLRRVFNNFTATDWVEQFRQKVLGQTPAKERVILVSLDPSKIEQFRDAQVTQSQLEGASSLDEAIELMAGDSGTIVFVDRIGFSNPNLLNDIRAAFRYSPATELSVIAADDPGIAYELRPAGTDADFPSAHAIQVGAVKPSSTAMTIRTDVIRNPNRILAGTERSLRRNRLSIVIPVFNNGPHLLFKCLQSLWRASSQKYADIVIVDDGSTDPQTLHILDFLDGADSSIKVLRLPTGGSGSAARPRNFALDAIETPYVTFLDPDDEQMGRGYEELLRAVELSGSDIAVGNTVVRRGGRVWIGNVPNIENGLRTLGLIADHRGKYVLGGRNNELLSEINFQPFSIQATVACTDFLRKNRLRQIEGAFGEDSLFSLQMLHAAESISFARTSVFIYNAEVPGSAVNSVSIEFFRKSLASEKAQVSWLRELNLLNAYSEKRFMKMMNVWYLQKLKETRVEERQESLALIHGIAELYGPAITQNAEYRALMADAGFKFERA